MLNVHKFQCGYDLLEMVLMEIQHQAEVVPV